MSIYVLARRSYFYHDFRISGFPDIWKFGDPDIWKFGNPEIWIAVHPDFRIAGDPPESIKVVILIILGQFSMYRVFIECAGVGSMQI